MVVSLALLLGPVGWSSAGAASPAAEVSADTSMSVAADPQTLSIPVTAEPDGTPVTLDADLLLPDGPGPHPVVVVAHGFGGSKESGAASATGYRAAGYAVLAYSARGFGASGGRIHLNDPDYEVADVSAILDVLSTRSDIRLDGPGDPRAGVVGGSYGGAVALMAAAKDPRIDAVVASVTWHDLAQSLFPQSAVAVVASGADATTATSASTVRSPAQVDPIGTAGVFRQLWGSAFFASGLAGARTAPDTAQPSSLLCGRFDPTLCTQILTAGETGTPSPELLATLRAHGPGAVLGPRMAPTLLIQGLTDSLFGLDQADANARAVAAAGAPVAVRWTDGGHDAVSTTAAADAEAALTWLDAYVGSAASPTADAAPPATPAPTIEATPSVADAMPLPGFTFALPRARRQATAPLRSLTAYPALTATTEATDGQITQRSLSLLPRARADLVLTPLGGQPASMTSLPGGLAGGLVAAGGAAAGGASAGGANGSGGSGSGGAGGTGDASTGANLLGSLPTYPLAALPGASAQVTTRPLGEQLTVVGSPRLTFDVLSTGSEATLFASLWLVQGDTAIQPRPLVAPLRVPVTPGVPTTVTVALPAGTWVMDEASQWRVLLTSTDSAFAGARAVRADRVSFDRARLEVPVVTGGTAVPALSAGTRDADSWWVGSALGLVLAIIAGSAWWNRRRRAAHPWREDLADTPLVITSLVKTYADGHRAVDDVSWRAERGQVVGLLGPNGAGKTTTMRMMLGLIRADSGTVHVLGHEITAGSPILRNVGALVEGPGFLPHLTGRQNLHAYWQATGRPVDEADFDAAYAVAALGGALDRPARTYSHGMKQRLGIAQAMLGTPDLLFLDEPTNGLDPPQIAAMRPMLQAYAAAGRTVVVSSHLLAEVEMTCSHVVVMHAGRVVTTGAVADLVASEDTTVIETSTRPTPTQVSTLSGADGIRSVEVIDEIDRATVTVVADLPRDQVIAAAVAAGLAIAAVGSRRHLEEVFLGVIADAADPHATRDRGDGTSMMETLRQVRAR